jgi:hypothetical protein
MQIYDFVARGVAEGVQNVLFTTRVRQGNMQKAEWTELKLQLLQGNQLTLSQISAKF